MNNRIYKYLSIAALALLCSTLAFAAGEKERMLKRIPEINALKSAGIIGEKADGLLGFVKKSSSDMALVDAENEDRKTVYASIAKSQGVSAAKVAERRALQIAEQASPGHWLQNADGKWYQKK